MQVARVNSTKFISTGGRRTSVQILSHSGVESETTHLYYRYYTLAILEECLLTKVRRHFSIHGS
jgi:hypothetical protein